LNPVLKSGALDLIGFSYHGEDYATFPEKFLVKNCLDLKQLLHWKHADIMICLQIVFADGVLDKIYFLMREFQITLVLFKIIAVHPGAQHMKKR
jgi:hypothetical protein